MIILTQDFQMFDLKLSCWIVCFYSSFIWRWNYSIIMETYISRVKKTRFSNNDQATGI